ncbi:MAG: hypothetical protein ACLR17_12755 [Enterobacteriaceae bacterium]
MSQPLDRLAQQPEAALSRPSTWPLRARICNGVNCWLSHSPSIQASAAAGCRQS